MVIRKVSHVKIAMKVNTKVNKKYVKNRLEYTNEMFVRCFAPSLCFNRAHSGKRCQLSWKVLLALVVPLGFILL